MNIASLRRRGLRVVPLLVALIACSAYAATTLDRIRERNTIVFAYRDGAAPFSFKDRDGRVRGYSVELCMRIAKAIERELRLSALDVKWIAVDAAERLESITSGRVDAECSTP